MLFIILPIIILIIGEDNKIYTWGLIVNVKYNIIVPTINISSIYININNLIALDNNNNIYGS
jgi:hypothetical protein